MSFSLFSFAGSIRLRHGMRPLGNDQASQTVGVHQYSNEMNDLFMVLLQFSV